MSTTQHNSGSQCFPFYVYDEDGSNRRENITDRALGQFRARYCTAGILPASPLASAECRQDAGKMPAVRAVRKETHSGAMDKLVCPCSGTRKPRA